MATSSKRERNIEPIRVGSSSTAEEFLREMRSNELKELTLRISLLELDVRRLFERVDTLKFPNRKEAAWSKS